MHSPVCLKTQGWICKQKEQTCMKQTIMVGMAKSKVKVKEHLLARFQDGNGHHGI